MLSLIEKDTNYVYNHSNQKALYNTNYISPTEFYSKYFYKKSCLVMYLIEKQVGSEGFQKILYNMVNVIEGRENVHEYNSISTTKFLKLCKKTTSHDLKLFAEKWIYSKGIPHFKAGFWFNKKQSVIEVAIKQDLSICDKVQGNILVRIYDVDGLMIEENVMIDDEIQDWQFKLDRTRRIKKKKPEEEETTSGNDQQSSSTTSTNENKSDLIHKTFDCPIAWIRIDPEMDWLRKISFSQPEFMLINQLEEDRDVIAQIEAIDEMLKLKKTYQSLNSLFRILKNSNIYYEVRMKAALSIAEVINYIYIYI